MIFNQKVSEYVAIMDIERRFLKAHQDSNTSKKIKALDYVEQFAMTVPQDLIVKNVESTKNTGKNVRPYEMFNIGSFCECLIGYHKRNYNVKSIAKSNKVYDFRVNKNDIDIKVSLSGTCKNTPVAYDMEVTFVNQLGAWKLTIEDQKKYADKYGRLPNNKPCGKYLKELSLALGF